MSGDPALILQEVDHCLPASFLNRALGGMKGIGWILDLESVAVLVDLSLRHAEDV